MTEKEEYLKRLDKQDEALEKLVEGQRDILTRMAEHKKEHKLVDPSLQELVTLLKGIKFMRATVIGLGSVCGFLYMAWVWAKDHIKI